jgi:hypothetical protein
MAPMMMWIMKVWMVDLVAMVVGVVPNLLGALLVIL